MRQGKDEQLHAQRKEASETIVLTRDEANVIYLMMAEFYVRKELLPDETDVFRKITSAFDFGRMPKGSESDVSEPSIARGWIWVMCRD